MKRVVLVTGSEGGIGQEICKALREAGHIVVGIDQKPSATIVVDLAKPSHCVHVLEEVIRSYHRIDGLINNAAIGPSWFKPDAECNHPTIEEIRVPDWDEYFAINVRAPMILVRESVEYMKRNGWGRIINITTSYRTMLRLLPYGASKAALEAASAVWAKELAHTGITCNVLVPGGPVDTPFIASKSGWPRDKMLRPEIMGPPAVWLMSEQANNVSGWRLDASKWGKEESLDFRPIGWPELANGPRDWQMEAAE